MSRETVVLRIVAASALAGLGASLWMAHGSRKRAEAAELEVEEIQKAWGMVRSGEEMRARQRGDVIEADQARIRALETDLHAARSRSAQLLIEKSEAEAAAQVARKQLAERAAAPAAPGAETPTPSAAEPEPPAAPAPEPPPRAASLGPTAVTDPAQVKKVVDGLNSLLALGEGQETWSITSAEAVDGDRLVKVRVEARGKGEGLSRSFRAAEARFVLIPSTRTLELRFRDGEVTYPGNRTVEFPGGRYSALLTVDPGPVRNAAHPLVEVPAR